MFKIFKLKKNIFKDKRGIRLNLSKYFLKNKIKFKDLHFVSLKKNTIRGNHKHPESKEWILLWEGKFKIFWKDKKEREIKINVNEPVLIFIPEDTPHLIKNIDDKTLYLFSFGSKFPMDFEEAIIE